MSGEIRAGWPVRRFAPNSHSCLAGESGGVSWGAWFACCPQGTYPKGTREDRWCDGRNNAPGNSTSHPQCADSKWKLWTLDGRYFCCDDGKEDRGYYYTNSEYYYFGCASDDWIANTDASVRRAGSYPQPSRYVLTRSCSLPKRISAIGVKLLTNSSNGSEPLPDQQRRNCRWCGWRRLRSTHNCGNSMVSLPPSSSPIKT